MKMNDNPYLNSISISGFKSIGTGSDAVNLSLADVNLIIGANGSGKSNLLSFFNMLNHMMAGAFQKYVGKNGTAENILHFGSKRTQVIQAALEFTDGDNTDIYSVYLAKTSQDSLMILNETITWNGMAYPLASGLNESCLSLDNIYVSSEKIVKQALAHCKPFQFHDTSRNARIRDASDIDNNRSIMSDGGNLAAFLYRLKNTSNYKRYYDRIINKIQFVMPQFADFILEPQALNPDYIKLRWRAKNEAEYTFGADQLSDGTMRFMALATLLLQPPDLLPSVIIIDEPELGLHPQAIGILSAMMKTAALHSQIIVATQSARLIDSFDCANIIVAEYDEENECSRFRHLDEETLSAWLNDYSLSELWEKNVLGGQP